MHVTLSTRLGMTQNWEENVEGRTVITGTLADWRDRPAETLGD